MNKKVYWTLAACLVGVFLAQKANYWVPGTNRQDIENSALGAVGGAVIGFMFGCIVENTADERRRRFKILYWLLAMAIFGCYLGLGTGVRISTTLTVMVSTLGVGLVLGLVQYFLHPKSNTKEVARTSLSGRLPDS
jgi:hypothetical protein